MHKKFDNLLKKWKIENVTSEEEKRCKEWLMGHADDNKPCRTFINNKNNLDKAPYYQYNKYVVEYTGNSHTRKEKVSLHPGNGQGTGIHL